MSLPIQTVDIIITNATILTMDPENSLIEEGFLAIESDTISRIGTMDDGAPKASKVIDAKGGLVLPGLVNGHTHAAMTLFRGLADDLPLMDWLNHYIFPVESRMDGEFVYTGTLLACAEMIMGGTTTFCDMYLFEDEVAKAAHLAGLRGLMGEVLYDFPSPNYGPVEKGFEYSRDLIEKWEHDPLISIAVEPHSPFTCSPELLKRADRLSKEYGVPLIIHVAETLSEVEEVLSKYGRKPVEHLDDLGLLGPHLIADHCVHLDESEMERLVHHSVKVIHNPESNMKLASGICPVPELQRQGVTVGLGTDGCASNNNLDLFAEMDMAAKLQKVHSGNPAQMDAITVLKMATRDGAAAIGLEDRVGSLEKNKKADVIVLDLNRPHLTPLYNPYSQIVYAARGSDVLHSIINGRIVMENRRLLTIDLESVMDEAREKSRLVRRWLG